MKKKNKTPLKICLILVAVLVAVFAVLMFVKTRVQPPKQIVYVNQYTENLQKLTAHLTNVNDARLESHYQLVTERIELMQEENLISQEERDNSYSEFMNEYVPAFKLWCDHKFSASVWEKPDLQFMRARVTELQQNEQLISSENNTKLEEVKKVLTDYDEVWKLGRVNITKSLDSRNYLNKAKIYKQDPVLSHCTAVMNFLETLKSTYQKKHFAYVNNKVKSLKDDNYELSEIKKWRDDYNAAGTMIQDYNSAASTLYGVASNNFELSKYFGMAKDGFRRRIQTMSKWDEGYNSIRNDYQGVFNVSI